MPFFFFLRLNHCKSFNCYVLATLKDKERRRSEIDDLPVLPTCWSGTLALLSSKVNVPVPMQALSSWRPLTDLTQTFQACHWCTFNVAAIFRGHPTMEYYRTPLIKFKIKQLFEMSLLLFLKCDDNTQHSLVPRLLEQ